MSTPNSESPWQFQPLPPDHLHPLTFLRPDVLLHVHELWKTGKHNESTYRTFSLPDNQSFRPFYMMGTFACLEYLKDWRLTSDDVKRLSGLESLAGLPAEFWNYLTDIPHFTGSVKSLPDGQVMGFQPIRNSPEVLEMYGDDPVPLNLVIVHGRSAEVALISEAFAAILDFSIEISMDIVTDKIAGRPMMYYETERELHPYWAKLAATIESLSAGDNPLNKRLIKIWLWSDGIRDPDMPARAQRMQNYFDSKGHDAGVLARMEIIR